MRRQDIDWGNNIAEGGEHERSPILPEALKSLLSQGQAENMKDRSSPIAYHIAVLCFAQRPGANSLIMRHPPHELRSHVEHTPAPSVFQWPQGDNSPSYSHRGLQQKGMPCDDNRPFSKCLQRTRLASKTLLFRHRDPIDEGSTTAVTGAARYPLVHR